MDRGPRVSTTVGARSSAPNRVSIEPAQLRLDAGSCAMSPCAGQAEVTVEQDNTISPTEWVAIGVHYVCSAPHIPIYYDESTSFTLLATDDDERNLASTMSALELNERRAPRACTRVALSVPPTAPVTIPVESSDTTAFIPETTTLTFDSTNWYEPRTICVHSVDDSQPDGTQQASLRFAPADSTDPGYDGFDGDDLPVRVTDDETPGVTFHTNTPHVRPSRGAIRGGLTAIFTNTAPTGAVDLSLSSSQPTDIDVTVTAVDGPGQPALYARWIELGPAVSTDPQFDGETGRPLQVFVR